MLQPLLVRINLTVTRIRILDIVSLKSPIATVYYKRKKAASNQRLKVPPSRRRIVIRLFFSQTASAIHLTVNLTSIDKHSKSMFTHYNPDYKIHLVLHRLVKFLDKSLVRCRQTAYDPWFRQEQPVFVGEMVRSHTRELLE